MHDFALSSLAVEAVTSRAPRANKYKSKLYAYHCGHTPAVVSTQIFVGQPLVSRFVAK